MVILYKGGILTMSQRMKPKYFVMEEFHLLGGWTAIEGNGDGEILYTHDSEKDCQEAIDDMVKDWNDNGLEYSTEEFRVMPLTPFTKLRDGLSLSKEQGKYVEMLANLIDDELLRKKEGIY